MNSEDSLIICQFLKNIESCSLLGQMSSIIIDSWPDLQYRATFPLVEQAVVGYPATFVSSLYSWACLATPVIIVAHRVHSGVR